MTSTKKANQKPRGPAAMKAKKLTFAEERARIKLPYGPVHTTVADIKRAIAEVDAEKGFKRLWELTQADQAQPQRAPPFKPEQILKNILAQAEEHFDDFVSATKVRKMPSIRRIDGVNKSCKAIGRSKG